MAFPIVFSGIPHQNKGCQKGSKWHFWSCHKGGAQRLAKKHQALAHKLKVLRMCSIRFQLWSAGAYFTDSLKSFLTGLVKVRRTKHEKSVKIRHFCVTKRCSILISTKITKMLQTWNMLVARDRKASNFQKISAWTPKYEGRTSISLLLEKWF